MLRKELISEFLAFLLLVSIVLFATFNFLSIFIIVALSFFISILLFFLALTFFVILLVITLFIVLFSFHRNGSFITIWRNILAFSWVVESFDVALNEQKSQ
jgi:hypothetical protein